MGICQYAGFRQPECLAEGSAGIWTAVLLNPRKALVLCACGTVAASLAAHESMNTQRHKCLRDLSDKSVEVGNKWMK